MKIIAIDPGPTSSAWVEWDAANLCVRAFGKETNEEVLKRVERWTYGDINFLVIEQVASFGMAVGADVFETVFWSGRFAERWARKFHRIKRLQVKLQLCQDSKAKDPNIRQALIDRFGPGKEAAIGLKKTPGPLYGISGDTWAALAVAVTFSETCEDVPSPTPKT